MYNAVQKIQVSKNKLKLLFSKKALVWSKVTDVYNVTKIYISINAVFFNLLIIKESCKKCILVCRAQLFQHW